MAEENIHKIALPLTEWYRANKRSLPWRQDKEPYHVWISEIMLQQTRIEAVIEHYYAFMTALPEIKSLAEVEEETLLKLWEGLGYYSRARNLKKAAITIMEEYGGEFPTRYEQLKKLPGIGEYTAGAIASICFNERVPAVDGNVLRVLARLREDKSNVLLAETKKKAEALLREIIPDSAGEFNEGLMELGETVCLPNGTPLCSRCPLREWCKSRQAGTAEALPVRIKTSGRRTQEKSVFILQSERGNIALLKRDSKGLLAGLYELPNTDTVLTDEAALEYIRRLEPGAKNAQCIKQTKHIFTHIEWRMKVFFVPVSKQSEHFVWSSAEELEKKYALPTAFQKCLKDMVWHSSHARTRLKSAI